jgi:Xaa-Pro aminopeptidase
VHKTTIAAIKPGITIREVGRVMRDAAKAQGIERYVLPGPGHYTGMAPHDVGDYNAPFEPGVVFNVEPLLVVAAEGLHIRLEDTVLCTQDGFEVLTDLGVLPWEADSLLKMRGAARD